PCRFHPHRGGSATCALWPLLRRSRSPVGLQRSEDDRGRRVSRNYRWRREARTGLPRSLENSTRRRYRAEIFEVSKLAVRRMSADLHGEIESSRLELAPVGREVPAWMRAISPM